LIFAIWAFFDIAAWYVKLALEDSAIVARHLVGLPIVLLFSVPYPRDSPPVKRVCHNVLCGLNFFWPTLDHWHAAIENALESFHQLELISQAIAKSW